MSAVQTFLREMDVLTAYNEKKAERLARNSREDAGSAQTWAWSIGTISILGGILLAVVMIRGINDALRSALTRLQESAGHLATATKQLAGTSQELSSGSSEQAASLQETSASTEEIRSLTRRNSENARTAADVTAEVSERVLGSNRMLDEMVESMRAINDSSDKISRVMKVIEGIAFQTNILALNAAVEAARAGEAGMGFAVVADEVRNLAQRCADAAKDTSGLIEDARNASYLGKQKLEHLAGSIRSITGSAARVKELSDQVYTGSQEQARGVDQIATAITQMEQVTQRSAATSEQTAAASEQISSEARNLHSVVIELGALVGAGS